MPQQELFMDRLSQRTAITFMLSLLSIIVAAQTFIPGVTYYDSTGFVEYRAGNLPIILSAPHGGNAEPNSIPDRDCFECITINDAWTKTITEGMDEAIQNETGCYPHVIINLLHRKKFDANRNIGDAADGNPIVEEAWYSYHQFIESAKNQVVKDFKRGLFLDIHGHGDAVQRIQLGYLLNADDLEMSDAILNTNQFINESSIKSLVEDNVHNHTHAELIRGTYSYGDLLGDKGFPSVPSSSDLFPLNDQVFFEGGYNTQRHGSRDNNEGVDAIQLELNNEIRFDDETRATLIDSLSNATIEYIDYHYNDEFIGNFCNLILANSKLNNTESIIDIFPNPASNYFNLSTKFTDVDIEIYNLYGQLLHVEKWSKDKIEISFIPNGYYLVQFKREGSSLGIVKLVKG